MIEPRKTLRATALVVVALIGWALAAQPAAAAANDPALSGVVNINTASVEELQLLPGVGEVRAHAIVAMRTRKGGFRKVDELVEVKGIGDAALKRMRPYLTVSGKTTARSR